jgi:starch synthase
VSPVKRLAVCLLASEVAPLSKTGGLADVAAALTKILAAAGHDVRLFTPAYASVDRAACAARPVPQLQKLRVGIGAQAFVFSVLKGKLPGGAPVYLIDCPPLFARATLYTSDPDEHVRFLAFTRAARCAGRRASCIATTGTRHSHRCSSGPATTQSRS